MKKTKVIIPALGILLLSTAASVTGTVAWFTTNNSVTANGMKVKAVVTGNLFIEKGASIQLDLINKTEVDITSSVSGLQPVDFVQATGGAQARVADFTGDGATAPTINTAGDANEHYTNVAGALITAVGGSAAGYASVQFVSIANKTTDTGSFFLKPSVTVEVNDAASNLAGALRGGIVIGTSDSDGIFYESADSGYTGTATASGGDTVELTWPSTGYPTGLDNNKAYSVALILWYEGDDAQCFVNNAQHLAFVEADWTLSNI